MLLVSVYFLVGLLILLISTNYFVKYSKLLAFRLKLSPLVVGILIVGLGTSLPELAVSTTAAVNNDYGLALGNIIGSNISNILLVLPVGIIIGKLRIGTTKTPRSVILLMGISFLYFILHIYNVTPLVAGILLLITGAAVTVYEYKWGVEGSTHEDLVSIRAMHFGNKKFTVLTALLFTACLIGITFGGLIIVDATENLSKLLGYSTTILGLSLTAVSTSFPELFTTVFSQGEDEEKLTLGNIIGSNIYNLTLIGGISVFFSQNTRLPGVEWLWFIGTALLILSVVMVFKGKNVPKSIGIVLVSLFLAYLYFLTYK